MLVKSYVNFLCASIPNCSTNSSSFPYLQVVQYNQHYGNDNKYYPINFVLRGYVYSDAEDSTDDIEQLCYDIEQASAAFAQADVRIVRIETDSGLMSPLGVCDLEIELLNVKTD